MKFLTIFITFITLTISSFGQTNYIDSTFGATNFTTFNQLAYTYVSNGYCTTNQIASIRTTTPDNFEYYYKALVINVVDGDTVDMLVDLGFNVTIEKRFRLFGINAPEMKNDTNNFGHISKEYLTKLIDNKHVIIKSEKDKIDKYGRYIVTILLDNVNINEKLVEDGNALKHDY